LFGGSLQIEGNENGFLEVKNLNQISSPDSAPTPAFLNARSSQASVTRLSSSQPSIVRSVTFSYVKFSDCIYARPQSAEDIFGGGLIGVVGLVGDEVELKLENVEFSTITSDAKVSKDLGSVNGGALYGKYLKSVIVSACTFATCVTASGSGGALYIEEVVPTSEGILLKKIKKINVIYNVYYFILLFYFFSKFISYIFIYLFILSIYLLNSLFIIYNSIY
jgi:hypothetical protein